MVIAAAALSGCGLIHGSAAPPTTASHTPVPTHTPAVATAQGQPAWIKHLGGSVAVGIPGATAAGHTSPGAAVMGEVNALNSGHAVRACSYFPPATQASCRSHLAGAPPSAMPTVKNFVLGYVAIDGRKALVGSTGRFCVPGDSPTCTSNTNPAAILDSGKTFGALWRESVAASNSNQNTYSLAPCIRIGRRWYVYVTPSGA
jgi:hypothetical protein